MQMEKKDCESGIEGTKSDRTWTMAGVGGSRRRNQRCTPSFASELGGVCDAANRIRDPGRLEEKMSLFLNQLIESQCFQVIGVEEPNCECGTRL